MNSQPLILDRVVIAFSTNDRSLKIEFTGSGGPKLVPQINSKKQDNPRISQFAIINSISTVHYSHI